MPAIPSSLTPEQAWQPIDASAWTEANIVHLLNRIGFCAHPDEVAAARKRGLLRTLGKYFAYPQAMPITQRLRDLDAGHAAYQNEYNRLSGLINTSQDPDRTRYANERNALQSERQRQEGAAYRDFGYAWLNFAAKPQNSAVEKLILFFLDVLVVDSATITNPYQLFQFQHVIRSCLAGAPPDLVQKLSWDLASPDRPANTPTWFVDAASPLAHDGGYPDMIKAISRCPAMVNYLSLQQASRGSAPNENFAREVMELFVLGESGATAAYTEADIKAAAHAFTGYRERFSRFYYDVNQTMLTSNTRTVLGETIRGGSTPGNSNWGGRGMGDQVIDLLFRQAGAATFLPRELAKYYFHEESLPAEYLAPLAAQWRAANFNINRLVQIMFSSRLFYHEVMKGNIIKSPLQFYLGTLQHLGLDVTPLPNWSLTPLRNMGQEFFNPPNVRGWLGHRNWINSNTVIVRRQFMETMLSTITETSLNADDRAALDAARAAGRSHFTFTGSKIDALARMSAADAADWMIKRFFNGNVPADYRQRLVAFLSTPTPAMTSMTIRVRHALIALLESPSYHVS